MKRFVQLLVTVCILFSAYMFTSCSTRTFSINCQPANSLIMQGNNYSYQVGEAGILGVAPLDCKLTFLGKDDSYFFAATKRGFYPDTIKVTKDSALSLAFHLKPIEGADTTTFNPARLKGSRFTMLPVLVDVYLHKGVGNLDKYEYTETQSKEVNKSLDSELSKLNYQGITDYPGMAAYNESVSWPIYSSKICDYLLGLNANLLNYYPEHPSIKDIFWPLDNLFQNREADSLNYLVFTYCKTVKPTAGRIVGNIAVTVASCAGNTYNGYSTSYFNPAAFSFDNNTLIVSYVICPQTGKVLFRKDMVVGYDIVGEKGQKNITATIMDMMKEFEGN